MVAVQTPLLSLTAFDLMSRDVVTIPRAMSLRGAAHLLSQARVSGAPVVDDLGRCTGVISASDFMRLTAEPESAPEFAVCSSPDSFCAPWQMVEIEELPADTVGTYMTPDPVMVSGQARIGELARKMIDAHIRRVVVVDAEHRPIGIVSSTDILAAVAEAA
jgi:CBS domain-containing protein